MSGGAEHLAATVRWRWTETAFWVATLLPFAVTPDYLVLASQVAVAALFALSLDLLLGYTGLVSLGHAAYFGIGAYTAGLLGKHGWGEPISGFLVAGAVAALLGQLASFLIVRVSHLALLMITLGLGLLLFEGANRASWLTGGDDGLQGVVIWKVLGVFEFDLFGYTAYGYALAVLFLCFLCARRIIHSPFGLSLRGLRENARRMPAIGVPSRRRLRTIYTLSAAFAGVAGAVLTQTTQFVGLETLSFERSADVLVMIVLGGTGLLYGGPVGAIVYLLARDQFSGLNPQYWYFWMGALLILVVLVLPNGVLGGLHRLATWRRTA